MQEFEGKVAVVTGAASGIGRAMAERFAAARMRVVLADVEEPALSEASAAIEEAGATVLPTASMSPPPLKWNRWPRRRTGSSAPRMFFATMPASAAMARRPG